MFSGFIPARDLLDASRAALQHLKAASPEAPETKALAAAIEAVDESIAQAGREAHIVAEAHAIHADDDHEIDDVPALSESADNGWWVSGWFWVPN